jgi:hypothetical protein
MPPIYIMAAITLAVSAALWGGLLYVFSGRQRRYLWLLLPGLPLSAVVNLAIKRSLVVGVGEAAGIAPGLGLDTPLWFITFVALVAPVTEEAIKVAPLLLRPVRRAITGPASAVWAGFGLGVSYGLGEAAFLAYGIAGAPAYAGYPWYAFTGYLGERLMVCFAHAVMTAIVVAGWQRGGWRLVLAYLGAVGLHTFLNLGAVLAQLRVISPAVAGLTILIPLVLLALVLEWLRRAAGASAEGKALAGEVVYFRREGGAGP